MARVLPDDRPATLLKACGLGAASTPAPTPRSRSRASIFRKGADFTAAMAFEFASTNLVIELTASSSSFLIGWQFAAAEFFGAIVMIAILALLFRRFLTPAMIDDASGAGGPRHRRARWRATPAWTWR